MAPTGRGELSRLVFCNLFESILQYFSTIGKFRREVRNASSVSGMCESGVHLRCMRCYEHL